MTNDVTVMIMTVFGSVMASGGFWAWLSQKTKVKSTEEEAVNSLLVGIAHEMIVSKGSKYIDRGYITSDELEDFMIYLWNPYSSLGGNGLGHRIHDELHRLPLITKKTAFVKDGQRDFDKQAVRHCEVDTCSGVSCPSGPSSNSGRDLGHP